MATSCSDRLVMSSTLEDLFIQILRSEQKAQERKSLLSEVKTAITQRQHDLETARNEKEMLRGQLAMKVQQWNDEEEELKWLNMRESIHRHQRDEQQLRHQRLKKELGDLSGELEKARCQFFEETQKFCQSYDLLSCKAGARAIRVREEISGLEKEKEKHLKVIEDMVQASEEVCALETEKATEEDALDKMRRELSGLDADLEVAGHALAAAEEEKDKLSQAPQTSEEFTRLQRELECCQDDTLEGICSALKAELEELRRGQWQREVQEKQQRQRQHVIKQLQQQQQQQRTQSSEPKTGPSSQQDNQPRSDSQDSQGTPDGRSANFRRFTNFKRRGPLATGSLSGNQETKAEAEPATMSSTKTRPNLTKLTSALETKKKSSQSTGSDCLSSNKSESKRVKFSET